MGDDMILSPQQIQKTNLSMIEYVNNMLIYHRDALCKGLKLKIKCPNQVVMNQVIDWLLSQDWKLDAFGEDLHLLISM